MDDLPQSITVPFFHLTTFSKRPFGGNPAGVCLLRHWLPERTLLAITAETALPVVAFLVRTGAALELRWFTAVVEEEMCGHATLAAAWVCFNRLDPEAADVTFATRAGPLRVARDGDELVLDLPARPPRPVADRPDIAAALGATPVGYLQSVYNIALFASAAEVAGLAPDFDRVARLDRPGLIVTAPGAGFDCDIVTRYFAPAKGIPEDAATGSAHAQIVPYWSKRLGRARLTARQLSARSGAMICEDLGSHVRITAPVRPFLHGELLLQAETI